MMTLSPQAKEPEREKAVGYVFTAALPELFLSLRLSLAVTTYQAQRVMLFSALNTEKLTMLMRVFPRPTGLALEPSRMAMACRREIWIFKTAADIRNAEGEVLPYDRVYLPRTCHVTGDIGTHQLCWLNDTLQFINTRFSCLSTLHEDWSFVPGWKPPFISQIVPEDRCHLNGFCHDGRKLRYATALGESDTREGWRANRAGGGVLIDMQAGEVAVRNLCMPHNPVLYAGKLWLLESGTGSLLTVDQHTGATTTVARFPGFLRGLAFYDRFAFVGLCQAREHDSFGGMPIQNQFAKLICAVQVVDISSGQGVGFIEFTKGIEELFDIQPLVGPAAPHIIGIEDEAVEQIIIPPPNTLGYFGAADLLQK